MQKIPNGSPWLVLLNHLCIRVLWRNGKLYGTLSNLPSFPLEPNRVLIRPDRDRAVERRDRFTCVVGAGLGRIGYEMKALGHPESGTVLIVDDNAEDILITQRVIKWAYPHLSPLGLESGEKLVSYLEGEHGFSDRKMFPLPFLVLLDLKMPGMHGFEVLQWLRSHPPSPAIPVVVLTSSGEVQLAHRSYQLGARSFLTKPLTANEFRNMMSKFQLGPPPPPENSVGQPQAE